MDFEDVGGDEYDIVTQIANLTRLEDEMDKAALHYVRIRDASRSSPRDVKAAEDRLLELWGLEIQEANIIRSRDNRPGFHGEVGFDDFIMDMETEREYRPFSHLSEALATKKQSRRGGSSRTSRMSSRRSYNPSRLRDSRTGRFISKY